MCLFYRLLLEMLYFNYMYFQSFAYERAYTDLYDSKESSYQMNLIEISFYCEIISRKLSLNVWRKFKFN